MPPFVPGLELSRRLHRRSVHPIMESAFPAIPYGAALLGRGSEVLGFDDEMSTDHDWAARVLLFLRDDDLERHGEAIGETLHDRIPDRLDGYPTDVAVVGIRAYFARHLDLDLGHDLESDLRPRDWLTFSEERLCMLTAGAVHHDDVGLRAVRDRLAYYPRDVWLYLLIAGWWRIHPEANLVGRVGGIGDELGSALIGSRLVTDIMRLAFLMERRYAPYSKWFGTAFSRLGCATVLSPLLENVLRADSWRERETALMSTYEHLAAMHDALGITKPVPIEEHRLWDRPYTVLWGDFPGALREQLQDPEVLEIAERWPAGPIDQLRDLLWAPGNRPRLLRMFD